MTDKEKQLIALIIKHPHSLSAESVAQAILKAGYRKMEPVWEGEVPTDDPEDVLYDIFRHFPDGKVGRLYLEIVEEVN